MEKISNVWTMDILQRKQFGKYNHGKALKLSGKQGNKNEDHRKIRFCIYRTGNN